MTAPISIVNLPGPNPVNPDIISLHNDPDEYDRRVEKADYRLPGVLARYAYDHITRTDSILDLGCGTGIVMETLMTTVGYRGFSYGNDISLVMADRVDRRHLYTQVLLGHAVDAAQYLRRGGEIVDWAIGLSVAYYLSEPELAELIGLLCGSVCRKGVILSFEAMPAAFQTAINADLPDLRLYDWRRQTPPGLPPDWTWETIYSGLAWRAVVTKINIEADVVVLQPNH